MAVVAKKRTHGTTYYVVTFWQGRTWPSERAGDGTDKREAERLDARRKREVKAGTYMPHGSIPKPKDATVAGYAELWGKQRENTTANDDRRNLARFTSLDWLGAMAFPDVRPKHVIAALKQLRGSVSEKSLQNAYGTFRTMCRDAVIAEVIPSSPCVLPRKFFDGSQAKEREVYSKTEAAVLVSHRAIPSPVRVLNALCLLGGLREGEACGRRWGDLDHTTVPLWAMSVASQYEGRQLKTRRPRVVPVHPELVAILNAWAEGDFAGLMGRKPDPDDYIVPYLSSRSAGGHYTRSIYYKAFVSGCAGAGIRARSLHSTRHTMVTMARRGGADRQVLSKVTHNAKGDMIDRYSHHEWPTLCAAVLAIGSLFDARPSPRRLGETSGEIPREIGGTETPMLPESHDSESTAPSSIPGASTDKQLEKRDTRQSTRQSNPRALALLDDGLDAEDVAFSVALAEHPGANPPARPPVKTKSYVARKRGARG